jgi:hypothetical protein
VLPEKSPKTVFYHLIPCAAHKSVWRLRFRGQSTGAVERDLSTATVWPDLCIDCGIHARKAGGTRYFRFRRIFCRCSRHHYQGSYCRFHDRGRRAVRGLTDPAKQSAVMRIVARTVCSNKCNCYLPVASRGRRTSKAYRADPCILASTSSRVACRPISSKAFGSFSRPSAGGVMPAALGVRSPKVARRPLRPCVTTPFCTPISSGGTPQAAAAAALCAGKPQDVPQGLKKRHLRAHVDFECLAVYGQWHHVFPPRDTVCLLLIDRCLTRCN